MKLNTETTVDQFRDEMQHRVVKYPLNSRPVKEALQFAKKHEDPAFYRVASDKVHAQRQFQRELYGPGKLERLVDFFTLGSLREVVVTLILVVLVLLAFDSTESLLSGDPAQAYGEVDVDVLAERMGFYMRDDAAGPDLDGLDRQLSDKLGESIDKANIDQLLAGKMQTAVENSRIDELAVAQLDARLQTTDLEQLLAQRIEQALAGAELDKKISEHVDGRLAELDKQIAERMAGVDERVLASVEEALDTAGLKDRIATRIDEQLAKFDEEVAKRISTALTADGAENQIGKAVEELLVSDAFVDRLATAIQERLEAKQTTGAE
jgi:hypothetical protein